MSTGHAIIVAIENYHNNSELHKVAFALNDAEGIRGALVKIGYKNENIETLTDHYATRSAILEKVKNISKYAQKGDSIVFYYSGHGVYADGKNFITCVDTQMSSINDTCVSVQDILGIFDQSSSKRITLFLDCCHSGLEFDTGIKSPVSLFSTDDLKYQYANTEFLTGFAACKGDEKSRPDTSVSHGVWSYFLIQALSGEVPSIYDKGILFSDRLQAYLLEQTTHRVKMMTTDKKTQTPIKFGKETDKFIVADVSHILEEKKTKKAIDKIKFKNVSILTFEEGLVASLPGFEKGKHKPPRDVSDYCNGWIKRLAQKLLEKEINETAARIKRNLGFKRKEMLPPTVEEGIGEIVTPEFDYVVCVCQHDEEPDTYVLKRSIENFKNSDIIYSENFNDLFDDTFDELHFHASVNINVEQIIDQIEDLDDESIMSVNYDHVDLSRCSVTIPAIGMTVEVARHNLAIQTKSKQSPLQLLEHYKNCHQQLMSHGVLKLLA